MIIKNISNYFEIHKLTYLFILLSIFTASFHLLVFISFLLIVHEMGHFLTAKLLGIKVDKIYIYPFGGIAKFHMPLNYSFIKEFLILINGPLFQEMAKNILIYFFPKYQNIIIMYHYSILIFNLLPIYPLDGGKLVNLMISTISPYKKSFKITIWISYTMILFLFLINMNNIKINLIIIITFLIYKVFIEEKKINYIYENFLLERYIHDYTFKSSKIITREDNFYKNKRHLLKLGNNYSLEKDFLKKKYEKNKKK